MKHTNRRVRLVIAAGFFLSGVCFYIGQLDVAGAFTIGAALAIALS